MSKVRTRFAPSPTGFLHIGSLRTVLFGYLIAKSQGGDFILRIEDTDQKREVSGAQEKLLEIINWIGIEFDEGPHVGGDFGPYVQSERIEIYKKYTKKLLDSRKAYRCFCSPERLQQMREEQQKMKLPPRYDGRCRHLNEKEIQKKLNNNEPFVVRQKMPKGAEVLIYDELRGEIKFRTDDLDDHVLIKTSGMPTYQFANVVDDHLMKITHVLRGEEWISSFPKNILLYRDFGWEAPKFIHMPLTLNKGGGKLSKRQGDVAVEDYREKGYLKEALINFSILLGWSPYVLAQTDKPDKEIEIFSLRDVVENFQIKDMGVSPAVFDTEKLDFLNGYYIRHKKLEDLAELCMPYLAENINKTSDEYKRSKEFIAKVVKVEQERLKKLSEIGELTEFFFIDELIYNKEMLAWKKMEVSQAQKNLKTIIDLLENIPNENWTDNAIEEGIVNFLKIKELKIGEYLWPMRVSLTGRKASPGPFEVAQILGKKETINKIKKAINM